MELKIPKQFRHWASEYGFSPERTRLNHNIPYLYNKDSCRYMRVNSKYELQVSDVDFDRWANSVEFTIAMPKNRKDFKKIMNNWGFYSKKDNTNV